MRKDARNTVSREQSQEFFARLLQNFPLDQLNPEEVQEFIKNPKQYCQQFADSISGKSDEVIELPPLASKVTLEELEEEPYIDIDLFPDQIVKKNGFVDKTYTTLHMQQIEMCTRELTDFEVLRTYPPLRHCDDEDLLEVAGGILPSRVDLFSAMTNAIIETENFRANLIPRSKKSDWNIFMTVPCVCEDGHVYIYDFGKNMNGWLCNKQHVKFKSNNYFYQGGVWVPAFT